MVDSGNSGCFLFIFLETDREEHRDRDRKKEIKSDETRRETDNEKNRKGMCVDCVSAVEKAEKSNLMSAKETRE